jgi:acyl carrier protein
MARPAPEPVAQRVAAARERVREIVVELAPDPPAAVTTCSRLAADLGYDSLALLELAAALEDELELPTVSADDATGVETLGDVEELVVRELGRSGG